MGYRIAILVELLDTMDEGDIYDREHMTQFLIEQCEISNGPAVVNAAFRRYSREHFFDRTVDSICITDRDAAKEYLRECRVRVLNHALREND